ncbi:amino acid adenylation domain-containing protein [Actinosynnema sp. NPDC020468]|uniref:non-ribosomal peptide synthetase n=1 Tax=Actinosynnema sp. NPDC020468 TaxID=3154488 RepID=UPI0033D70973
MSALNVDPSELVGDLEGRGVDLWEQDGALRFRAPTGVMTAERTALLRAHKAAVLAHLRERVAAAVPDPARAHDPFPLTDVQAAYLVGRREVFAYGGVGCHGYGEITYPAVDPARLTEAVRLLVARHAMLRAVFDTDLGQRVLEHVPPYEVAVTDARGGDAEPVLAATREEMDHARRDPARWPLFDIRLTRRDDGDVLHFSLDFLIADFVSVRVLVDELETLLAGGVLPAIGIGFRDWALARRAVGTGGAARRDRAYWWDRLDSLPPAPDLPLLPGSGRPRFRRHAARIEPRRWRGLRERAAAHGVTPSTAVLAAYQETLARWSARPDFTLNVTLLDRLPLHPDVDRVVGDFTTVTLLALDKPAGTVFADRARRAQQRLWQDLDHRLCSGVEVLRELARRRGQAGALMPVVFTSAIGLGEGAGSGGRLGHGVSQTPQVVLDCQNIERDGGLDTNWDVREGVLPDGVAEDAFAAFADLLDRLSRDDGAWLAAEPVVLPAAQTSRRAAVNATAAPVPAGLLHTGVFEQALRTPDALAVVCGDGHALRYAELAGTAHAVAGRLRALGVGPGDRVGVVLDRGWRQPVAVLAVCLTGAAYVPVDTAQPPVRRDGVLTDSGVRAVLTQPDLREAGWPDGPAVLVVDEVDDRPVAPEPDPVAPDDPAYVIFTSGSTGRPKGVVMSHRAALNTVRDVDSRFGVTGTDRVLGLSDLGFDLSVHDVFGPLALGGRLVLPAHARRADPSHWAELVLEHGVTLWNSVPGQLRMYADYLGATPAARPRTLRQAWLSGDWIPLELPDRVRALVPGLDLVSMGGATEAAIWSIHHRIGEVRPEWRSVPYGLPLANQTWDVLDAAGAPCPDWVPGELHIGGIGQALGYLGDPERTAAKFTAVAGRRLYRTGDLGRYHPDGSIELLGRIDSQVKVRGHRVETGEVAAALATHPAVGQAAVVAVGPPTARELVGFVEPARCAPREHPATLVAAAKAAAARAAEGVDGASVVRFGQVLDATALAAMLDTLVGAGLFADTAVVHDLAEVLDATAAAPRHHRLLRRWLRGLTAHGLLERTVVGYRRTGPVPEPAWDEVERLAGEVDYGADMITYFRTAAGHLPGLLRGDTDPLALLFPDGGVDIHVAAYTENFLSRYLNAVAAAVTAAARPASVLEVGAGVGGTSAVVVPALDGTRPDYLFTDVAQFFLTRAADLFADRPWVRFGRFDLAREPREQGAAPNSHDVVLCANVLHYAKDVGRTLEWLHGLLTPGGLLVFLENTKDNYAILTSMEFLFDATSGEFADQRGRTDDTFVGRDTWLRLLTERGLDPVLCLPEPEDPLAHLGMHVFVAVAKSDRVRVDRADLAAHLAARLPAHMVPPTLHVEDAFPVNANGKVDPAALVAWHERGTVDRARVAGSAPETAAERALARLWGQVLRVDAVGRDREFYALGGDSLLASQLAGRLAERLPEAAAVPFDDLLRHLVGGTTVAGMARWLESSAAVTEPASDLVPLGGGGGEPVLFVPVDGDFDAYSDVLATTTGDLWGLPSAGGPDDYAAAIVASGHTGVRLVGHGAAGPIAVGTAARLAERGVPVAEVVVSGVAPEVEADLYVGDVTVIASPSWPEDRAREFWSARVLGEVAVVRR